MQNPKTQKVIVIAALLALTVGYGLWPELRLLVAPIHHNGPVNHVRDGDTIEVDGLPIRLSGVTCDERGTPLGTQATNAVRNLVRGETLACHLNGEKTYDRSVGRCALENGRDLGQVLIDRGLCGRCARYDILMTYTENPDAPFKGTYPSYCNWIW
ncbi:thermonuclease family protein [Roseibium polysiphoniae]|uniref:TNase-like domain-containing protein n=1 Tax=Roseibium polysiphoniae TaxID=2571221 RepID=A0ABR9C6D7_9HYPH|nr:hypothetical protein [Roseibium polysiphoniae]MBD8875440.1 hypothetical protein [Roseibium polysiphoniae]